MQRQGGQWNRRSAVPLAEGTSLHRRYSVRNMLVADGATIAYDGFDYVARQPVTVLEFFPGRIAARSEGSAAISPNGKENGELYFVGMDAFYRQYGKLMQTIGSPNVLTIFDVFFENGTAYAIAEPAIGASLYAYIHTRRRQLSDGELVYIARALSDALLVVHSCNTMHHGITADCILLCPDGTVKLTGFAAGQTTVVKGRALRDGEPWNDIRALGEALYTAYTGAPPPADDAQLERSVPNAFAPLFSGMLSKNPSRRFDSLFDLRYTAGSLDIPPVRPDVTQANVASYRTQQRRRDDAKAPRTPMASESTETPSADAAQGSKRVAIVIGAILLALLGVCIWALIKR